MGKKKVKCLDIFKVMHHEQHNLEKSVKLYSVAIVCLKIKNQQLHTALAILPLPLEKLARVDRRF